MGKVLTGAYLHETRVTYKSEEIFKSSERSSTKGGGGRGGGKSARISQLLLNDKDILKGWEGGNGGRKGATNHIPNFIRMKPTPLLIRLPSVYSRAAPEYTRVPPRHPIYKYSFAMRRATRRGGRPLPRDRIPSLGCCVPASLRGGCIRVKAQKSASPPWRADAAHTGSKGISSDEKIVIVPRFKTVSVCVDIYKLCV